MTLETVPAGVLELRLSPQMSRQLRCPACKSPVVPSNGALECGNERCGCRYPVVDGIPALLDGAVSLFNADSAFRPPSAPRGLLPRVKRAGNAILPKLGRNVRARRNYRQLLRLLHQECEHPKVLVIGGRILGQGMEEVARCTTLELVETDVTFGPRTNLLCDAHELPFEDGTFDGVIIQAVLGNLADPYHCVAEIHRVLRDNGLVYAETAFLQAIQDGGYDFTRFTHTGIRRLFRNFSEIDSGAVCGPGMALAKLYERFLISFSFGEFSRLLASAVARCTAFWMKWFDDWLVDRPGGLDAASGVYFLGRRSRHTRSDRDIVASHRGLRNQMA